MLAGNVVAASAERDEVALSGRTGSDQTQDDVLTLILKFAGGAVGWARADHPPTQSLTLHTTATTFDVALDPDFSVTNKAGAVGPAVSEHPFRHQMRAFLVALRHQDPLRVRCSARDAAGAVDVALAAATSLAAGGQMISIKERPTWTD